MVEFQLNYDDIDEIFREKLKIDNIVKSVDTIFNNERYFDKINYKPYFQRNYVWDEEKATYFIESILLGTEIPPLVFFKRENNIEVIDGRQRFETIERFLKDKLVLKEKGLHDLKFLAGKKFSQIDDTIRSSFNDTRIRILQYQVVNEPKLDDEKEDRIKKEIFRRYNSGITPLQKYDIERAIFIDDSLTNKLVEKLNDDVELFEYLCSIILPRSKRKVNKRDKINILVTIIREMICMEYITIYEYVNSSKIDLTRKIYFDEVSKNNIDDELEKFINNIEILKIFSKLIDNYNIDVNSNQLFFNCLYWIVNISILNGYHLDESDANKILNIIQNNKTDEIWKKIDTSIEHDFSKLFEQTGSHYYLAIMNRFNFMCNVFSLYFKNDFSKYIKRKCESDETISQEKEFDKYKINKALPETLSITDIMRDIKNNKFSIRPNYQRSEVKNIGKSSYLMESILLGINIPPLFIFKREDGVKEVIDGQQRLLTLLGFLGEEYIDENGDKQKTSKDKFKLTQLKIMKELKGKNYDNLPETLKDKILDFSMDIIEIDQKQNKEFSPVDLFLRLNTKPYPIKDNTFEMWNAYLDKKIIIRVKELAEKYNTIVFGSKDVRMNLEELIISLAYIDYKTTISPDSINSILVVYLRYNRVCARLADKTQMSKHLYEITTTDSEGFLKSLDKVEEFSKKVYSLTNGENNKMKVLLNHSAKVNNYKTDQNFYFLWLLLKNIELELLENHKESIFNSIKRRFANIQSFNKKINNDTMNELFNLNVV